MVSKLSYKLIFDNIVFLPSCFGQEPIKESNRFRVTLPPPVYGLQVV